MINLGWMICSWLHGRKALIDSMLPQIEVAVIENNRSLWLWFQVSVCRLRKDTLCIGVNGIYIYLNLLPDETVVYVPQGSIIDPFFPSFMRMIPFVCDFVFAPCWLMTNVSKG